MGIQMRIFEGDVDFGRAITNYLDLKDRFLGYKYTMSNVDDIYKEFHGANKRIELVGKKVRITFDFSYENIAVTLIYYDGRIKLSDMYDIYTNRDEFYDCVKIKDEGLVAIR